MAKTRWLFSLVTIACFVFILTACSSNSAPAGKSEKGGETGAQQKVTLKVVSAWAQNNKMNDALWMLQETVKQKSGGRLEILWGGGPEAIPSSQLVEALKNGVVEMAWTAHTYNVSQLPVVEGAKLSKFTPWEEREKGVFDFYQKIYQEKLNAYYLGKGTPGLTYNLYTTVPIKKANDFKGLTIRVTPAYKAFVEALGAAPVTTDPGEVYTALERKMIQGYGWPSVGISDFGWEEATKFIIDPPFYQVDVIGAVSLKAWNQLPKDLQDILNTSMQEVERRAYDHFKQLIAQDREKLQQKGLQVIELPPEEADKYLAAAYDAAWKQVIQKDPQLGPQLQKLLGE